MKPKIRILHFLMVICFIATVCSLPVGAQTLSPAGEVTTKSTTLNIRQSPSASAAIVGRLSKGTTVTLLSQSGNWYKVQYNKSAVGYCSADYITPLANSKTMYVAVTSGNLNVRRGAGTNYAVKTTLVKGSRVVRLSVADGWSRILYNGSELGYVSSRFLATTNPTVNTENLSLSVPRFYQTDSRWSHITMGNSSATIGRSGCATTALAMTESYRLGQTITPAMMEQRLTYTSGGSVYWPSQYSQTTNRTNYLSFIYDKLKAGKPVILGLKKANGSMHFVVVTGCKGDPSLSSSYTVNDPGTSTRTNLSQVLAVYPNFYKMLWVK